MSTPAIVAIVDDDLGVRVSLDSLIRSLGHGVATFEGAEAFLASEAAAGCACVISDVQMPGALSGLDLARVVSSRSSTAVILISAFVDKRVRTEAGAAGVRMILAKPFDAEVLIGCLENVLAG